MFGQTMPGLALAQEQKQTQEQVRRISLVLKGENSAEHILRAHGRSGVYEYRKKYIV